MTFKTFLGTFALACALVAPASFVFAEETEYSTIDQTITVSATTTEITSATEELEGLKIKEQDPETGSFMKFILRLKIRQLENQLNIKKALK
jgi:hypothetical protein